MEYAPIQTRQRINLTLDPAIVSDARELGLNLSQECEQALSHRIKEERARRWQEENRPAIQAWNAWMEKNGLPLARYRLF